MKFQPGAGVARNGYSQTVVTIKNAGWSADGKKFRFVRNRNRSMFRVPWKHLTWGWGEGIELPKFWCVSEWRGKVGGLLYSEITRYFRTFGRSRLMEGLNDERIQTALSGSFWSRDLVYNIFFLAVTGSTLYVAFICSWTHKAFNFELTCLEYDQFPGVKLDKKLLGLLEAEQVTNLSRKLVEPAIDRFRGLVRRVSSLSDTISPRHEYDWLLCRNSRARNFREVRNTECIYCNLLRK
jgi:hypothetical protein